MRTLLCGLVLLVIPACTGAAAGEPQSGTAPAAAAQGAEHANACGKESCCGGGGACCSTEACGDAAAPKAAAAPSACCAGEESKPASSCCAEEKAAEAKPAEPKAAGSER
jgi:hypothetical protein